MLFFLTSRIVSALAAFLYPGYASYKALSQRPASEADLERWLMYWSVLGCVVGVEYVAEWLISWIPLYSTFKAIFFLYLALPQTQGSTYIYMVHLRPFFAKHEGQIDMAIAEVRVKAYHFLQEKARAIWAAVINALSSGAVRDANAAGAAAGQGDQSLSMQNPGGGPTQLLSSFWTAYGPGIIAGGTALLRQTAAATLPTGTVPGTNNTADVNDRSNALNTPPGSTFFHPAADPISERRRQLEAELASLTPYPSTSSFPTPIPIPTANNSAIRPNLTPSSSSSSVRERVNSGRFEEIKGGEVEGYKVDENSPFVGGFVPSDGNRRKSGGWFWGSGSSVGGGSKDRGTYDRVKNE
jgi:receptor expression-enhancing protein 1/2/3/4